MRVIPRPIRWSTPRCAGRFAVAALAWSVFAATALARAEPGSSVADGRSGRIEFRSVTPSGPTQLVRRSYPPGGTVVAGDLVLPPAAPGRVPAMVIAHGSGGILPGREDAWARRLNAVGIASFVVDSFGPRGLTSTATDQSRLSTMANVADALSALRLLATHPRIDPARIGVIGFSRGGQVALYSALEPVRRSIVDDARRFAAHVALYPSCSIPYHARQVTGAPILMLLGAADDYTPPKRCHAYADWFRGRGAPVQVAEYAGAYHDFDLPVPPRFLRRLQSARGCNAEVDVEAGAMRRVDTGEALRGPAVGAYLRSCTQRGATIGGNAAALARAERDVVAFLSKVFGLPR
jgi:dienelactone hydrolase